MADPPTYPDSNRDTGHDTGVGPGPGSTTGTPRWVKVFGIIALVLVLLFVISLLTGGGGGHGPGRHTPSDAPTLPSSGTGSRGVEGHKPPAGGHRPG